jgi:hypothetical protein
VIGSEKQAFFDDPQVRKAFARDGLKVEVDPAGSRQIATSIDLLRWDQLKNNSTYPVRKNILVSTTDPRSSSSAAMYLAIASYVANGDTIVRGDAAEKTGHGADVPVADGAVHAHADPARREG